MTALAAGSTASVTLDANDVLIVTGGNANYTATPTTGSVFSGYLTGSQRLGPFKQYVTVSLSALTAIDYSSYSETDVSPVVTASTDLTGRIALQGPIELSGDKLRNWEASAKPQPGRLVIPADWAISTAYELGVVVKNSGNKYVCIVAGTSAGSGGPTHTTGSGAADGTCNWTWLGPYIAGVANADIPTFTSLSSSPGALPVVFNPVAFPGAYTILGGYATTLRTNFWELKTFNDGVGDVSRGASVGFVVDDSTFAIFVPSNSQGVRVKIDGNYYSESAYNPGGADRWMQFDFSTYPRKRREVIVECGKSVSYFGGVRVSATGNVCALKKTSPRVVWIGDSLDAGAAYGPWLPGGRFSQIVASYLGWEDVWSFSTGGTGYIATNGGSYKTYGQRVAEAATRSPDVWVLRGSTNDSGQTGAAIQAAVLACIQSIRSLSAKPIIVCGVWPKNDAQVPTIEAAVSAAVTASGFQNVFFVPEYAATPLPYVTGAWNNSANSSSVNSTLFLSADGTHPIDYAIQMAAQRSAADIKRIALDACA